MASKLTTYLVGGAVRDRLLNLPIKDRDWVVVGSTPEEMVELGYQPVGKHFPVFIERENGEEYALARTERKIARGYQGFDFNTSPDITLEQDLERRDITINAMAEAEDGTLIDPFNGASDLKNGIIRHVSEAFIEDPVRVLRVARFAARFNFSIAPETLQLMSDMVDNGEVDALVAERVCNEMLAALQSDSPRLFFETLRECGALAVVLPEIDKLFGVPQSKQHHPEIDTGIHTMMVLDQATKMSDDPIVRFAALTHDLGKAATPASILPRHIGHEQRGLALIDALCDRLKIANKFRALALAVGEYHLHMHRMFELRAKTVLKMLEKTGSLRDPQRANDIALCCTADARGRTGFETKEYPQAELFLAYAKATQTIDTQAVIGEETDGKKIRKRLDKARLAAISAIKQGA